MLLLPPAIPPADDGTVGGGDWVPTKACIRESKDDSADDEEDEDDDEDFPVDQAHR